VIVTASRVFIHEKTIEKVQKTKFLYESQTKFTGCTALVLKAKSRNMRKLKVSQQADFRC
jgi:hypothetical protein